jgi:Asp-tRNA(Asn)/Glu-tRNA(Gln) amidotransferase A subunit family amidase
MRRTSVAGSWSSTARSPRGCEVVDALDPFLDATAMAERVRRKVVSPAELIEATIRRIEAVNPALNAVIIPTYDKARREASMARGPFRGVPYTLKDITILSKGDLYTAAIRGVKAAGYRADHDSYFAQRMREAGFVLVGRTNTPELGISPTTESLAWGPCRNPWDPALSAGASSGGAAACVGAALTPVAHGNDGGGSVRMPAALCGVVGLKPTRGRISTGPGVNVSDMVAGDAHEGLLARSVRDIAALLDIVGGHRAGDGYAAPTPVRSFRRALERRPRRLRIGVLDHDPTGRLAMPADNGRAVAEAAEALRAAGHEVRPAWPEALERDYAGWPPEFMRVIAVAIRREVEHFGRLIGRPLTEADVEPRTWTVVEAGRDISGAEYAEGIDRLRERAAEIEAWWEDGGWDLLVTPTTLVDRPPAIGRPDYSADDLDRVRSRFEGGSAIDDSRERYRGLTELLVPFNISGQPAISLPTHVSADGLPIGTHLVAAYGREDLLLQAAQALEAAFPWAGRRPPLFS